MLIDARSDLIYPSDFMVRVFASESSPQVFAALRQRYDFDWVVACNRPGQLTHTFLANDPGWRLVHYTEPALVYVRADRYPALESLRFRWLDPVAPDVTVLRILRTAQVGGTVWRELGHELERARRASPLGLRVLSSSALFFHHSGPAYREQRDAVLVTIVREYPEHPVLPQLVQALRAPPMAPGAR